MLRAMMAKMLGIAVLLALTGCSDLDRAIEDKANEVLGKKSEETTQTAAPPATPPPTPVPTVPPAPTPEPQAAPTPEPAAPPEVKPAAPVEVAKAEKPVADKPKSPAPKPATQAPAKPLEIAKPDPAPAPKPVPPVASPAAPTPTPTPTPVEVAKPAGSAPRPVTKVTLPNLKHVKVSMPARVQELLDADPRMQPWLNVTLETIEDCYKGVLATDPSASGTIKFVLEMHANARPDADITSLPPQLSGVVACGTGKLMRTRRMPLFTGKEGEKHSVSVKLSP